MNIDLALVAAVLETKDYPRALRAGVTSDLLTDEAQSFWDVIEGHYETHHEVPSPTLFTEFCPQYKHVVQPDSIEALTSELKTRKLGNDIDKTIRAVAELNLGDPWLAKKKLYECADAINIKNQLANTRTVLGDNKEHFMRTLDALQAGSGLLGYAWPWEYLNSRTTGVCPANLIYIYGREKSRKTFLLLYLALWFWSQGLKVLVFTREMPTEELEWRCYALLLGMDFLKLTKGQVSSAERQSMSDMMDMLKDSGRFITSEAEGGIAGFQAEIEEVKPHIVFHDAFKYMADDEMKDKLNDESKFVAQMANKLKKFAMTSRIPIFFCGHANRDGEKSKGRSGTEHAWSDNIIRRVDLSLRVITDNSTDRTAVVINRARNMQQGIGFTVNGRLCRGFGDMLEESAAWTKEYNEADVESEASKANVPAPQGTPVPARYTAKSFAPPNFQRKG